jgi:hypothetical protein
VAVEVHAPVEIVRKTVEIREEQLLRLEFARLRRLAQVLDEGLRVDLLLDVDRHDRHRERLGVLRVLALPHKLRVERGVARVEHGARLLLVLHHEVAQLFRRDVDPRVLVADRLDGRRAGQLLLGHGYSGSAWRGLCSMALTMGSIMAMRAGMSRVTAIQILRRSMSS